MDAFAIYRLPHASRCTLVGQEGLPSSFVSLGELGDGSGFVIAPFAPGNGSPIIVLRPDTVRQFACAELPEIQDLAWHMDGGKNPFQSASREAYHDDFCRFHRTFSENTFQKLVLARSADTSHLGTDPVTLFSKACERYPEAFVALFSAPQCGTWLIATPEVLLTRDNGCWNTMALAGTMCYSDHLPEWSEKNIQEQNHVSEYINSCLSSYSNNLSMKGPYTVRAGNLVHLRTDFSFTLKEGIRVIDVLASLHPTPAVCGVPKGDAYRFIIENESCDRSYYSGFSGPLDINGDTSMFVSLRCMRIFKDRYRLYAGGGILPQSDESSEWEETAAKMQTMLSLIE